MEDVARTPVLFMRGHFAPFTNHPHTHDNTAVARATAIVNHLTVPQPKLDGRITIGGPLRVGEMERDVFIDVDAMTALAARFHNTCAVDVYQTHERAARITGHLAFDNDHPALQVEPTVGNATDAPEDPHDPSGYFIIKGGDYHVGIRKTFSGSQTKQTIWWGAPRKAVKAPKPTPHAYRRPNVVLRAKL